MSARSTALDDIDKRIEANWKGINPDGLGPAEWLKAFWEEHSAELPAPLLAELFGVAIEQIYRLRQRHRVTTRARAGRLDRPVGQASIPNTIARRRAAERTKLIGKARRGDERAMAVLRRDFKITKVFTLEEIAAYEAAAPTGREHERENG